MERQSFPAGRNGKPSLHSWDEDLLAPKRTVLIVTPQPRNPRVAPVVGEHTAAGGGARHAATVGWWDGEVRIIDGGPRVKFYTKKSTGWRGAFHLWVGTGSASAK